MADAERPTKRQRLNAEYSSAELDNMCCSICTEPFVDPVSLRGSGHTYCRACITQALANQRRCSLSNARITIPRHGGVDGVLDPNHQVRSMMDAQRVACAHAARGCTERPKLGDVEAHEASCAFAPKKCARCPFLGSRAETEAHERSCPYVVLGPVLDAQANRIQSLERKVTEQGRTNERLTARLDALERSNRRTVTPASARRPPRDAGNVNHTFNPSRCDNSIDLSEGGTLAKGSGRAITSSSFDSGIQTWRLHFTETDRYICIGVCTGDMCFSLSLAGSNSGTWRLAANRAQANVPWIGEFKAGSTLDITYNCGSGEFMIIHEGSPGFVRRTFSELASKRVSPFVFLTSGNTCRIDGGGAVVPAIVEHRGLTFDAGRCFRVDLSGGGKAANGHGDAVASEIFDSGKHCWKLRFPATDRWVGVGICTEDRDLGVALNPSCDTWLTGEVNGGNWFENNGGNLNRSGRFFEAQIPWRGFTDGSVLDVSFDCDTGTLSVGLAGIDGVVSLVIDELVSKRVSPFVFLTHGNCCHFVD